MDNLFKVKLLDEEEKEELGWNIEMLEHLWELMLKDSDEEVERALKVGYRLGVYKTILEISETLRIEKEKEKEKENEKKEE